MLFDPKYVPYWRNCLILVSLICFVCAGHAYRVNARRSRDDPRKSNYHPLAVLFAPLTWLLFLWAYIVILILRALFYSTCLILTLLALLLIRKSSLLTKLNTIAAKIGNKLLGANMLLLKILSGKSVGSP